MYIYILFFNWYDFSPFLFFFRYSGGRSFACATKSTHFPIFTFLLFFLPLPNPQETSIFRKALILFILRKQKRPKQARSIRIVKDEEKYHCYCDDTHRLADNLCSISASIQLKLDKVIVFLLFFILKFLFYFYILLLLFFFFYYGSSFTWKKCLGESE